MPAKDRRPRRFAVLTRHLGACLLVAPLLAAGDADPPVTARDRAMAWIDAQGWREGPNPDGAIVSVGAAPIPRDPSRPEAARALGFELACLDARDALATYLAAQVAASSRSTTAVGPAAGALRRIAPDSPADGTPYARSTYEDAVWVLARCELGALVPVAGFRTGTDGTPGMVSVVLRHDAGSAAVARALLDGQPIMSEPGTPGIDEWIAARGVGGISEVQGVRVLRGPEGQACVVAFAEADVVDGPRAEARAEDRARLSAVGSLRSFLGQFHDGRAILATASSLTEVAGRRPEFRSHEAYRRRIESASGEIELPSGVRHRRWQSPASGRASSIGVAVVFEPGARPAASPAASSASKSATVRVANRVLTGSASGVGFFDPDSLRDRDLHPAIRRARALRAAVVNAKVDLARAVSQSVATSVESESADHRRTSHLVIDVTVRRALLCGMALVRSEFSGSDERPECTAWIEGSVPLDPSARASSVRGLPAFADERSAASAVARWASSGLCDQSMVRVFVGPEGSRRLIALGVGLGAGPSGQTVAMARAQASLVSAAAETIEGSARMSQLASSADPLSPAGSHSVLVEELDVRGSNAATGAVRLGGSVAFSTGDGLVAVACWRAE
jgi:hypothetical protein